VAALARAFTGTDDGRDHLVRCAQRSRVVGIANIEVILIDSDAVSVFPFDQHHADGCWSHGYPEDDVQYSSKSFAG